MLQAVQAATSLIKAHRTHGHLAARLDPLGSEPEGDPALDPNTVGLTPEIMARIPAKILRMYVRGATLADALPHLRETYCGTIAYEIEHISSHRQRVWLREKIESGEFRKPLTTDEQRALLQRMVEVDALERFMHKAYLGQKQFSIEGLDTTVPMLDEMIQLAAAHGAREVVVGMAHRGRLNVLAHNLGRPYETIFAEFEGASTLEAVTSLPQGGTGDVKYHHGAQGTYQLPERRLDPRQPREQPVAPRVRAPGRARRDPRGADRAPGPARPPRHERRRAARPARRRRLPRPGRRRGVAEPAGDRRLQGRRHAAPDPEQPGRLHDRPRGLALDPVGVRPRQGLRHADHPRQRRRRGRLHLRRAPRVRLPPGVRPRRRDRPDRLPPLRPQRGRRARVHAARDVREDQEQEARHGDLGREARRDRRRHAGGGRGASARRSGTTSPQLHQTLKAQIKAAEDAGTVEHATGEYQLDRSPSPEVATAVPGRRAAGAQRGAPHRPRGLHRPPEARQAARAPPRRAGRARAASTGPTPRRSRSPRCSPRACRSASPARTPSAGRSPSATWSCTTRRPARRSRRSRTSPAAQAPFELHNSPLSEIACLGFEYGYSQEAPETLVLWEAQFGDFVNSAQVIVDQFIVSGLAKWGQTSRLTLLLPHGYEGSGPEHSSARLERFLQLAAEGNIRVANLTTPAQYFHLLRRQAKVAKQRPLVIMTPKSLLRLPQATNRIEHLSETRFFPVLGEPRVPIEKVTRLILCTGKIYYDLVGHPNRQDNEGVAVGRVELLYPFPESQIIELIESYPNLREVVWVQEEPRNMGARAHMFPRLMQIMPEHLHFGFIGRPERASPGEGYPAAHTAEQNRILRTALDLSIPVSLYPAKTPGER